MGDDIGMQRQDLRAGPTDQHDAWTRRRKVFRLTVALVIAVIALVVAVAVALSSTAQAAPPGAAAWPILAR